MDHRKYDLIVIGGGPSGMAAAVGASSNGVKNILILERMPGLGGILNQCIHQGFGLNYFKKEMTGTEYAAKYKKMVFNRSYGDFGAFQMPLNILGYVLAWFSLATFLTALCCSSSCWSALLGPSSFIAPSLSMSPILI
jgi:cation diffusion facilitator CzcD-associated flavoprotein CzcO